MISKTEVVYDSASPDFVQAIEVDFLFENSDLFMIEVYDVDDETNLNNLSKQEFIGSCSFTLHKIVSGKNQTLEAELINTVRNKCGKIKIIGEEKKAGYGQTQCSFIMEARVSTDEYVFITIGRNLGQ